MLVCKCPPEQHVGGKERQALADARLVSADRIGRMMVQVRSFRSAAHEGDHKDTRGRSQGHTRAITRTHAACTRVHMSGAASHE